LRGKGGCGYKKKPRPIKAPRCVVVQQLPFALVGLSGGPPGRRPCGLLGFAPAWTSFLLAAFIIIVLMRRPGR